MHHKMFESGKSVFRVVFYQGSYFIKVLKELQLLGLVGGGLILSCEDIIFLVWCGLFCVCSNGLR